MVNKWINKGGLLSVRVMAILWIFLVCMSFAGQGQSPGGVSSNLNVWLKGDAGTSALSTSWEDQSGNSRHYVTVAGPTVQSTALNFNPAVEILSGGFNAPAGAVLGTDWSIFFVAKKLASDNDGRLFEGHTGNYLWGYWNTWERSIYIDGNPFEVNTGIGVNNGGTSLSLQSYTRNNSSGALEARHNGQSLKTFTSSNSASGIRVDINEGAFRVESSDSHIGEFIIYNSTLGAIDVQKVESYLGIKYGLTLGQNYLASDGTIIWNTTTNSAYQNAVAGIGRDDNSALDQRKSKSVESGSVVTIDKGAAFSSDADFVVWGHDNAATTFTSAGTPFGISERLNRVWKAAVTGTPGNVSVSFEIPSPGNASDYVLLLDGADADFTTGATQHTTGASVSGSTVTFTNVPLADGMYFTLSVLSVAPGGVPANLNTWLKADAGTSSLATSWQDQSGNNRHYTTVAGPTVQSGALNFNPAVEILSGGFDAPAAAALGTDWSIFFVAKKLASDNSGRIFDGHAGNYLWGYITTYERSIYINGNPSEYISGIAVNNGGTNFSLQSYVRNNSSGALEARQNGQSLKTFASSNSASGVRVDINQGATNVAESSDSQVGEFIIYNSALGATDVQKVESYLGIKYGLTLNQNYLASDETVIWNATTNSAYQNAVAGIGRDDNSSLDQRQSKSIEPGTILTIDKMTAFTGNASYMIWGHDNAATTFTSSNVPSGLNDRLVRVWKAAVTGSPGTVSVSFEVTTPFAPDRYKLLLDGVDSDFSTGATEHTTGVSVSGNTVTFTDVPLANGMFFTLARSEKGPGGVVSSLSVWLKANAGTNTTTDGAAISSWQDQSINSNDYSQSTASSQPIYKLTSSNFNPAITFDGSDLLSGPDTNYTGGVVFAVVNGTDNGNFAHLLDGSGTSIRYEQNLNTGRLGYTRYGVSDYSSTVTTPFGRVSIISFSKASAATSHSIDELSNGTRSNATLNVGLATAGIPTFQMGIGLLGDVSEMIIYNNTLSTADKSKVESYLSLKYGLTLDQNYLASDGSILWNSTTNASYHNDVAGIGRDDQSELDQRKSKSVESSSIVTIDKGAAFSSDAAFVVWGHDNAATTFTSTDVPSGLDNRMVRVWKAAITGSPGTVSVSFEVTTPLVADRYKLLLDGTDSNFSAGATEHNTGVSVSGNTVTFTDVPLTDGMFFTLGTLSFGPGGVNPSLNVWLKADAGTSALSTSWEDQSSSSRHYTTVAGPTVQSAALNFNPAIEILSGGFDAPAGAELGTDWSMFFVAKKLASDNNGRIFDGHSGNYLWGYITTYERSIYINGNPSEYITGIAVNNGGTNLSLQSYVRNNGSGALEARQNGQSLKTFASSNSASSVRVDINQGATNGAESSDSQIGEFIIYNSALGAADVQKVESYLGVKYGLTLSQNYLTSDGTVIWNATANSAYHNDIVAIGRDDNSQLLQKQSKSINSAGIVTIGLNDAGNNGLRNSNAENQGVISANRTFVFLGNDTEALNARIGSANPVSTDFPNNIAGLQTRLNREWKLVRTGTGVSSVIVQFDIQTIAGLGMGASPNDETQIVLLVDDNGDFTSGNPQAISQSFVTSNADNLVTFVVNFGPVNEVFLTLGSMEQSSLPVDLLSFDALQQEGAVQIDWSVADVVGEMIYTVERSSNGRDFQEVGKVEEATNGGGQYVYSFKDRPNASGQFYYRLSLIKPSGETDYSEVIRVLFEHKEPGKPVVPYPNPFVLAEGLRLSLPGDTRGKLEVSWTSSTGRLLKKEIVSYAKNESVLLLNSEGIHPGMLILQIRDLTNHQVWNFKVIAN